MLYLQTDTKVHSYKKVTSRFWDAARVICIQKSLIYTYIFYSELETIPVREITKQCSKSYWAAHICTALLSYSPISLPPCEAVWNEIKWKEMKWKNLEFHTQGKNDNLLKWEQNLPYQDLIQKCTNGGGGKMVEK